MPTPIQVSDVAVALRPSPITREWVEGGDPVARNAVLATSRDGGSCTLVWDCSPGSFTWRYDTDETIHLLEGTAVLDDGRAPAYRVGPGAVVYFPKGAVVRWTVETHVRKLAFFRRPLPTAIGIAYRVLRRVRNMVRASVGSGASEPVPAVAIGMATEA